MELKVFGMGKSIFRDDVVSKMIRGLNGNQILGGFNKSKIREIFYEFGMR